MSQTIPLSKLRSDDLLHLILARLRAFVGKTYKTEDCFLVPERATLWLRDMENPPFITENIPYNVAETYINPELKRLLGTWL